MKCCGNNNKDEDNSPKNLNDKNQQASSQKFRQLKEGVLHLLQSSRTRASPSDGLMSYQEHSLGRSYPCAEMHSA